MKLFRIILIYGLMIVMLPWGAFAQAATSEALFSAKQVGKTPFVLQMQDVETIAPKPKRCRIAILAGVACFADTIFQRNAVSTDDRPVFDAVFFGSFALPDGVTSTGYLDPPRGR